MTQTKCSDCQYARKAMSGELFVACAFWTQYQNEAAMFASLSVQEAWRGWAAGCKPDSNNTGGMMYNDYVILNKNNGCKNGKYGPDQIAVPNYMGETPDVSKAMGVLLKAGILPQQYEHAWMQAQDNEDYY